jgi:hypothetical protein
MTVLGACHQLRTERLYMPAEVWLVRPVAGNAVVLVSAAPGGGRVLRSLQPVAVYPLFWFCAAPPTEVG